MVTVKSTFRIIVQQIYLDRNIGICWSFYSPAVPRVLPLHDDANAALTHCSTRTPQGTAEANKNVHHLKEHKGYKLVGRNGKLDAQPLFELFFPHQHDASRTVLQLGQGSGTEPSSCFQMTGRRLTLTFSLPCSSLAFIQISPFSFGGLFLIASNHASASWRGSVWGCFLSTKVTLLPGRA